MKLLNPWGMYEWKGIFVFIQVDGQNIPTSGVNNSGNNWLFRRLMTACFGFVFRIMYKTSETYVPANTTKITSVALCLWSSQWTNKSILFNYFSGFKGVFLTTKVRTQGCLTLVQTDHRKFHKTSYEYSPVRVIILKIDKVSKQMCQYINDIFDCDHDATMDVEL